MKDKKLRWALLLTGGFLLLALFGRWGNGGFHVVAFLLSLLIGAACIVFSIVGLVRMSRPIALKSLVSTLLPVIGVAMIYFGLDAAIMHKLRGRPVFSGTCEHTVTFVHLELWADGTCKYEPGSFLDTNWKKGTWTRTDSLVQVHLPFESDGDPMVMVLRVVDGGLQAISESSQEGTDHLHGFRGATDGLK